MNKTKEKVIDALKQSKHLSDQNDVRASLQPLRVAYNLLASCKKDGETLMLMGFIGEAFEIAREMAEKEAKNGR